MSFFCPLHLTQSPLFLNGSGQLHSEKPHFFTLSKPAQLLRQIKSSNNQIKLFSHTHIQIWQSSVFLTHVSYCIEARRSQMEVRSAKKLGLLWSHALWDYCRISIQKCPDRYPSPTRFRFSPVCGEIISLSITADGHLHRNYSTRYSDGKWKRVIGPLGSCVFLLWFFRLLLHLLNGLFCIIKDETHWGGSEI